MLRLLKYIIPILLLTILYYCKREEDPTFFVTASVSNSSQGTVTFNSGDYAEGASVTFTANPKEGYTFTNWVNTQTNQTYTNNPLTLSIDGNTTLVANFERNTYTLTVNVVGQGQVNQVLGGNQVNTTTVEYNQGDRVTLQTNPSDGWTFSRWQGDATGYEDSVEILMDGSKTVTATFDYEVIDDIIGAWDIAGESSSANKTYVRSESGKSVVCGFYALIFNPDYSFTLYYSLGTVSGEFYIQDPTSIMLINYGSITNISFSANGAYFDLELDTGCSSNINGEKDDNYDADNPPQSFLEKLDGTYWKFISDDDTYSKILTFRDNLPEDFGDLYDVDEEDGCSLGITNFNEFIEVIENYDDQLIYRYTYYEENEMEGTMSLRSDGSIQFSENYEDDSLDRIFIYYEIGLAQFQNDTDLENCDASSTTIYFENGTCKCPDATVGDTTVIDGVTYTVVDNSTIQGELNNGNVKLCTTLVTTMRESFAQKDTFNEDIGFWDTSNVTDMSNMFLGAKLFNQNIGVWDTSKVVNMRYMFSEANSFNQPIGEWDTSNVTDMGNMFSEANSFNQPIGEWDTSKVLNMSNMFYNSNFNQPINNWNVENLRSMNYMFQSFPPSRERHPFNKPLNNWNVSNVREFEATFYNSNFNQDISGWNISSSTNIRAMFEYTDFNNDIGNWNTSNVTDMSYIFNGAQNFNQDLTAWCVSNIGSEPTNFASNSALVGSNKPIWGTCPSETSSSTTPCTIGAILQSSNVQTVAISTQMADMVFNYSSNCSDTYNVVIDWSPSVPNGVSFSFINDVATISGTPTGIASGTYYYTLTASNTSGTATSSLSGRLIITSDSSSSTTTSGTTDTGMSSSTTTSGTADTGTSSSTTSSAETYSINVTASSSSDYTLSGTDRYGSVSGNDPSVTINAGDTINFAVNSPGHPFYVKTAQGTGTDNLASGVSGNGSESGTVSFTPTSAGTYYYQCSLHNGMYGTIIVQ